MSWMANIEIEQQHIDRANEWVSENYPELSGDDFYTKCQEVARELAELDFANTAFEEKLLGI